MDFCKEVWCQFQRNPTDFLRRFITIVKTLIHHYTTETKQQSKQWTSHGECAPKNAKAASSAGKVMATVFWYANGILLIDYLEKGKTITRAYYAALLNQLAVQIKEKRSHLAKKKVFFHQDNARVHTSSIAMSKLHELKYELVRHPPYSPDLALSDYYLSHT